MSKANDGGPAFPLVKQKIGYHADVVKDSEGLSIRDYFAGQALAGLMTLRSSSSPEGYAQSAYMAADAMLKEREKG